MAETTGQQIKAGALPAWTEKQLGRPKGIIYNRFRIQIERGNSGFWRTFNHFKTHQKIY